MDEKLPSSIREVLASFKVDIWTAELTEAADGMFDTNPNSKTAVTVPFATQ